MAGFCLNNYSVNPAEKHLKVLIIQFQFGEPDEYKLETDDIRTQRTEVYFRYA
jgi:hypothetical protein